MHTETFESNARQDKLARLSEKAGNILANMKIRIEWSLKEYEEAKRDLGNAEEIDLIERILDKYRHYSEPK